MYYLLPLPLRISYLNIVNHSCYGRTSGEDQPERSYSTSTITGISAEAPLEIWPLADRVHQMQAREAHAVTWQDLTVRVKDQDAVINYNFLSQFNVRHHWQNLRAQ
jgi:hypothetical protein